MLRAQSHFFAGSVTRLVYNEATELTVASLTDYGVPHDHPAARGSLAAELTAPPPRQERISRHRPYDHHRRGWLGPSCRPAHRFDAQPLPEYARPANGTNLWTM